jgi:hypothetical protein
MSKRVKDDMLTYRNDGFASIAVVNKQYQITEGGLHRVGSGVARKYKPFSEVDLPTALARVSSGETSPLEFASQFGEMGYARLVRNTMVPSFSGCLPKSAEWKAAHAAYQHYREAIYVATRGLPEGDPVDWLLAHSRTVTLCLDFIGLLSNGDEHDTRNALENVKRGPYSTRDRIISLPVREWRDLLRKGTAPSTIIRRPICDLITENTAGIRRWLISDPLGSRSDSFFLCNATIEAVYWQIADKMEAEMIRRCAECKRFFVARDKRVHSIF